MSTLSLPPGARCPRDVERAATGLCARCGDYVCGSCARRVDDRSYCPPCAERLTSDHSPRAIRAFVLGAIGVHGLFFLSPVALALAISELRAIEAGESSRAGRTFARIALGLGIAGLVMPLSVGAVWWLAR